MRREAPPAIHSLWTLHNAGASRTHRICEVSVLPHYGDGARFHHEDSLIGENVGCHHLGGRRAGEHADNEINPVVCP